MKYNFFFYFNFFSFPFLWILIHTCTNYVSFIPSWILIAQVFSFYRSFDILYICCCSYSLLHLFCCPYGVTLCQCFIAFFRVFQSNIYISIKPVCVYLCICKPMKNKFDWWGNAKFRHSRQIKLRKKKSSSFFKYNQMITTMVATLFISLDRESNMCAVIVICAGWK